MKGVIAAGISIALFKNPVTAKGMLGYFITVMGVVAYSEVSPRQLAGKQASSTITLGCMHASSWNSAIACAIACANSAIFCAAAASRAQAETSAGMHVEAHCPTFCAAAATADVHRVATAPVCFFADEAAQQAEAVARDEQGLLNG
eukprot:GHRQ01037881.1.p2 GENE.GHRQ01037881.1~~GHRQ01037881.1.p2  ORF type:complete len:146 (-),score=41.97 GHRQ01037881.1:438-875(-)